MGLSASDPLRSGRTSNIVPVGKSEISQPVANCAEREIHRKPPLWRILELVGAGAQAAEQQRAKIPLGTPMLPRLAQGEPQLEYAHA